MKLLGGGGEDYLNFVDGAENLRNHRANVMLKGAIYAGDGPDHMLGSDFDGDYFREYHFGEDGDDDSELNDGDDYFEGGDDDDVCLAEDDDDICWGDDDSDELDGGINSDCVIDQLICPSSGTAFQTFVGDEGTDSMWVAKDGSNCCTASDFSVDGGNGSDFCGDDSWGTSPNPFSNCENMITDWSSISGLCAKQAP